MKDQSGLSWGFCFVGFLHSFLAGNWKNLHKISAELVNIEWTAVHYARVRTPASWDYVRLHSGNCGM